MIFQFVLFEDPELHVFTVRRVATMSSDGSLAQTAARRENVQNEFRI